MHEVKMVSWLHKVIIHELYVPVELQRSLCTQDGHLQKETSNVKLRCGKKKIQIADEEAITVPLVSML